MGILNDINTTIKETDEICYRKLYDNLLRSISYLSNVTLRRGVRHPYLQVDDARNPVELDSTGVYFFINPDTVQHKNNYRSFETILPDWLEFRVKYNAYAKKHGYKPFVKLLYNRDYYGTLLFSNGSEFKEFDNCTVQLIEKRYPKIRASWEF